MLSQVGSVTTNGIQQKSDFRRPTCSASASTAGLAEPPAADARCRRERFRSSPASACSTRTTRIRASTRFNVATSRNCARLVRYVDFTVAKGVYLTRFLNYNVQAPRWRPRQPATRDTTTYTGANPFEPHLATCSSRTAAGTACIAAARSASASASRSIPARSQLRAVEGPRRRLERARPVHRSHVQLLRPAASDYGPSDRDIRHKFNFFTYARAAGRLLANVRIQGTDGAADHDLAAGAERR